ncbi:hypothetical protein H6G33_10590 [Calothrix sp. FACHB-1219]|uniref:hypothetical protein n=1 Tax=unclassified Calothrix TaxID=2619626 RepID=UPI00168644DD|nr:MULTISPECIES: hypothetical protein [unclassified Calothrix]MBD2201795.1 hypothetical protein [Calothrix sp. FACHB-168]MBD2217481.1 hypothetical protein [Calothrix sp. FACHB-1219]
MAAEYTNVVQLFNDFVDRFKTTLEREKLIGVEQWIVLLEELYGIKELIVDPTISAPLDNYKIVSLNPIDRLKLGNNVLSLLESGFNTKDITTSLENQGIVITEKDVKNWLKSYSESSIDEKIESTQGSVFDTQTQLQAIFDNLYNLLDQVAIKDDDSFYSAKTTKEQVKLEVMREIRQSLKDASGLAASIAALQTVKQFQKVVIEEVSKIDPIAAQRIWKRIQQARAMFSSLE